jgi:hypothetical protein
MKNWSADPLLFPIDHKSYKKVDNMGIFSKITMYETSSLFRNTREYMKIEETLPDS